MQVRFTNPSMLLASVGVLAVASASASAAITGVTGAATFLGVSPLSCGPGALSGPTAFAWDEQANVPLNLIANMVNNPGSSGAPVPGALIGQYDSHFIHWEWDTTTFFVTGTVSFNAPIVGVDFRALDLDATDVYGAFGTAYPTGYPFRGLTTNPPSSFSINANVLSFHFNTQVPAVDIVQLRVFTAVPAPGAAGALAMLGLVGLRRRR